MLKICFKCKIEKNLDCFSKNKNKKDGLSAACKECHKNYRKNFYSNHHSDERQRIKEYRKEIKDWFDDIKKSLCCEKCGENHPACLDFHHTNPKNKEFSLAYARHGGHGKARILEEISKCEVLCSNCHRKLHWEK
jgi:hypothetical protein